MNPATIQRISYAWEYHNLRTPRHILNISAESGAWPGTVYKALAQGYLERTSSAHYRPTEKMVEEIIRIERLR